MKSAHRSWDRTLTGGRSTKIHQLVGGAGLALIGLITPGQAGDSPMLLPLLDPLRVAWRQDNEHWAARAFVHTAQATALGTSPPERPARSEHRA